MGMLGAEFFPSLGFLWFSGFLRGFAVVSLWFLSGFSAVSITQRNSREVEKPREIAEKPERNHRETVENQRNLEKPRETAEKPQGETEKVGAINTPRGEHKPGTGKRTAERKSLRPTWAWAARNCGLSI
jgi:hypothetical protein